MKCVRVELNRELAMPECPNRLGLCASGNGMTGTKRAKLTPYPSIESDAAADAGVF